MTLLELLVVLVIIGIVIGTMGLRVDTGRERAETEAKRLAALLNLASEEAVLTGNEYAAEVTAHDYRFYQWRQGRWQVSTDQVFRERRLPAQLQATLRLPAELPDSASPLEAGDAPTRIYLLSSGEVTPFELVLADGTGRPLYRLTGSGQGKIKLADLLAGK